MNYIHGLLLPALVHWLPPIYLLQGKTSTLYESSMATLLNPAKSGSTFQPLLQSIKFFALVCAIGDNVLMPSNYFLPSFHLCTLCFAKYWIFFNWNSFWQRNFCFLQYGDGKLWSGYFSTLKFEFFVSKLCLAPKSCISPIDIVHNFINKHSLDSNQKKLGMLFPICFLCETFFCKSVRTYVYMYV
jgi:hypothetical protein